MSIENIISRYRETLENSPLDLVRDWKQAHPQSKIVGCYPVYTPVELIHAAAMLPVGVIGAGNRLEIAHADSRFQSFICSIVKSTLELGLTDRLKFLDGIVFHSICDPARNLGSVFKRNFPDLMVEYIHFPQNMASPHTIDYLIAEYKRVNACYEQLSGNRITDEALRQSIAFRRSSVTSLRASVRCCLPRSISRSSRKRSLNYGNATKSPRTESESSSKALSASSRPSSCSRGWRRLVVTSWTTISSSVGAGFPTIFLPKAIPYATSPTLTSIRVFIPE